MKVTLLVILACVAVSQAAFTTTLKQHVQPSLSEAMFKVRLASSFNRADGSLQTQIISVLEEQLNNILGQVENLVNAGQVIAQGVVQQFASAYAQLQSAASNIVDQGQTVLNNLASNLLSILGINKNQRFIGGLFDAISNISVTGILNGIADAATAVVNSIDLSGLIPFAIGQVIPEPFSTLIIGALNLNGRFVGGIFDAITGAADQAWSSIVNMANNVVSIASGAFNNVQQAVSQFVADALNEATTITSEAAQEFLNFLAPYQQDLGLIYDNLVQNIQAIMG